MMNKSAVLNENLEQPYKNPIKRFWNWLRKTKTRTVVLFFVFLFMSIFTIAVMIICNNGGMIPDSLIYCIFATLVVAVIMSGAITIKSFRIGEVEMELKSKDENGDDLDDVQES